MRPNDAKTPWHYLAATAEYDRRHGEERRHAHRRALLEGRPPRPTLLARLQAAIRDRGRQDHSLTAYACRLPDGTIGRLAVIEVAGAWTMVCRVA